MWLLLPNLTFAGSIADDFTTGPGAWTGGTVADGVLAVTDSEASVRTDGAVSLRGTARLRMADGDRAWLSLGEQHWIADYREGGGVSFGLEEIPFPPGHFRLEPDPDPVLEPDGEPWDGGNTLHCDVTYDEATGTYFLYWTGEARDGWPYRQIGLATSTDATHWTEYAGNPVLTIDYDRTTIDGILVHMPTVTRDDDGTWVMFYACYQNDVGNRICRATSPDGYVWTPEGMALDQGASGEFDAGSLREPDVLRTDDGAWHLLYNGTDPDQHYGPTGYAWSADGVTWEKRGAITADESFLQGGSMLATPWGVTQWYNVDDHFEIATADPSDLTIWTSLGEAMTKDFASATWTAGYVQAPSALTIGRTYHLWFNAYGVLDGEWHERIGHARSVPDPGQWIDVEIAWDGATLTVTWDGVALSTPATSLGTFGLGAEGTAELDEVSLLWDEAPADTGSDSGRPDTAADTGDEDETGVGVDTGPDPDTGPSEDTGDAGGHDGCGCGSGVRTSGLAVLAALATGARRRREGSLYGSIP